MVPMMMLNKKMRILRLLERALWRRFREYSNERSGAITSAAEYLSTAKGRSWSFYIATYAFLLLEKAVRRTSQIFHFQKLAILKEVLFRFQFIRFYLREGSWANPSEARLCRFASRRLSFFCNRVEQWIVWWKIIREQVSGCVNILILVTRLLLQN
jgi:hypothetical protein